MYSHDSLESYMYVSTCRFRVVCMYSHDSLELHMYVFTWQLIVVYVCVYIPV